MACSSRSSSTTTIQNPSTFRRRLQRQRCTDRCIVALQNANLRLARHHGSAPMSQGHHQPYSQAWGGNKGGQYYYPNPNTVLKNALPRPPKGTTTKHICCSPNFCRNSTPKVPRPPKMAPRWTSGLATNVAQDTGTPSLPSAGSVGPPGPRQNLQVPLKQAPKKATQQQAVSLPQNPNPPPPSSPHSPRTRPFLLQ